MSANQRFVLDINLIVSAILLPRSIPRRAFDLSFALGEVLLSTATLEELDNVLRRQRFDRYVDELARLELLDAFIRDALLIEVTDVIEVCRDMKDNKFLELAISRNASAIVSGDEDLLVLHPFQKISSHHTTL